MKIKEVIPRYFDANRKELVWTDIDSFLSDRFLITWFEVLGNVNKATLEYDVRCNTQSEYNLVLHYDCCSRKHVATIKFNMGDNRDVLCNELIERINNLIKQRNK